VYHEGNNISLFSSILFFLLDKRSVKGGVFFLFPLPRGTRSGACNLSFFSLSPPLHRLVRGKPPLEVTKIAGQSPSPPELIELPKRQIEPLPPLLKGNGRFFLFFPFSQHRKKHDVTFPFPSPSLLTRKGREFFVLSLLWVEN